MAKLNSTAELLVDKYIRNSSTDNVVDTRKRRSLQSEIYKLDAVRKIILNNKIDDKELLRFKAEVNKLLYTIESQLNS